MRIILAATSLLLAIFAYGQSPGQIATPAPTASVSTVTNGVIAVLGTPSGQPGVPLVLQYHFINITAPRTMPQSITVEGLDIQLSGPVLIEGNICVLNYTVTPALEGAYLIPAFDVKGDFGQSAHIPAVSLVVSNKPTATTIVEPSFNELYKMLSGPANISDTKTSYLAFAARLVGKRFEDEPELEIDIGARNIGQITARIFNAYPSPEELL